MKKRLTLLVALLALLLVASAFRFQAGQHWEYRVESMSASDDKLDSSYLSGVGLQGWELVAVESSGARRVYFFKRPK
jgi:hypothetical protein